MKLIGVLYALSQAIMFCWLKHIMYLYVWIISKAWIKFIIKNNFTLKQIYIKTSFIGDRVLSFNI